jgi:hypothetical protein
MSTQFDAVSVVKKGNVFFDGKCVSHTVLFADGSRKTVGVILPSTLTFNVKTAETMEIVGGLCNVRIAGGEKKSYGEGQQFSVAADSSFEIEAVEPVHYVCHFG